MEVNVEKTVPVKVMSNLSSNNKSRMKGDFHVRFCGNAKVKFLCVTRLETKKIGKHDHRF